MDEQDDMDIINQVITQSVNGDHCFSYQVHSTSERVLLFYGVVPKSHIDEIYHLILEQTDRKWITSPEVASLAKARYTIGHPELIEKFKNRLETALHVA